MSLANNSQINGSYLPALTGIRFFAIFHIFLFHLWVLYDMEKPDPKFESLLLGFESLPQTLTTFLSHGWMSTSFFFVLSGFILSYLYWGENGELSSSKRKFWLSRFSRIYPMHIMVLLITIPFGMTIGFAKDLPLTELVPSIIVNMALIQAWYPPYIPHWSWPMWTLSALVFLYFAMPYLMRYLALLSKRQMKILLYLLPLASLVPTVFFVLAFSTGEKPSQNWQLFIGSNPVFWLTHFVAGMLLARVYNISRNDSSWYPTKQKTLALGDIALLLVIIINCIPGIETEPLKYFFRHGLMLPFYLIIILDLAKHHGLAAKLFSLPGTGVLGETGFSIFIWQNLMMGFCWISLLIIPAAGLYHLWVAPIAIILISLASTYWVEKPISKWIRRRLRV